MKIIAGITVLLFTGAMAGGASSNLLLGTWKLSPTPGAAAASASCPLQMEFTAKASVAHSMKFGGTYTGTDAKGKNPTIPVNYVTGRNDNQGPPTTFPTVVYVMTDAGITYHVTYRFLSKDKMILDTAQQCPYTRQ
jgi:hypothetical protein